ncbi:uncharacterized protein LOC143040168 [Oratosquilla oratoria]|uniref:uncharacterized protein LOC143040168 n=1 Tax=Oratosquilla oratoria TaxID=337810 RepID=UPI003F7769C4
MWTPGLVALCLSLALAQNTIDEGSEFLRTRRQVYYNEPVYQPARPQYQPQPSRQQYSQPPAPTYSSEEDSHEHENPIPGQAGVDYPIYNEVPYTKFSCHDVPHRPGMYANPEAGCQAYHICNDDRFGPQGASFLCTNGTIFNQETFSCDWWYNVDCSQATKFYELNSDPEHNPYYQEPYDGPLHIPTYEEPEEPTRYQAPSPAPSQPNYGYRG